MQHCPGYIFLLLPTHFLISFFPPPHPPLYSFLPHTPTKQTHLHAPDSQSTTPPSFFYPTTSTRRATRVSSSFLVVSPSHFFPLTNPPRHRHVCTYTPTYICSTIYTYNTRFYIFFIIHLLIIVTRY